MVDLADDDGDDGDDTLDPEFEAMAPVDLSTIRPDEDDLPDHEPAA